MAKTGRTLCTSSTTMFGRASPLSDSIVLLIVEELNRADQASTGAVSAVPGVGGERSPSQPLGQHARLPELYLSELTLSSVEAMFLESCDITEVDVSFDDIPVELTVSGTSCIPHAIFHSSAQGRCGYRYGDDGFL